MKYNFYPFNKEKISKHFELVKVWGNKAIIKKTAYIGHYGHRAPYNGYVVIPNSEIPRKWQGSYNADGLQYLQIHGGITYCEKEGKYTVFGFDCAHCDDAENPKLYKLDYVIELTEQMEKQILEYAKRYKEWQKANKERKLKILDEIRATAKHETEFGLGGLLGIMFGGKFD